MLEPTLASNPTFAPRQTNASFTPQHYDECLSPHLPRIPPSPHVRRTPASPHSTTTNARAHTCPIGVPGSAPKIRQTPGSPHSKKQTLFLRNGRYNLTQCFSPEVTCGHLAGPFLKQVSRSNALFPRLASRFEERFSEARAPHGSRSSAGHKPLFILPANRMAPRVELEPSQIPTQKQMCHPVRRLFARANNRSRRTCIRISRGNHHKSCHKNKCHPERGIRKISARFCAMNQFRCESKSLA
jgi:hypothetical protein